MSRIERGGELLPIYEFEASGYRATINPQGARVEMLEHEGVPILTPYSSEHTNYYGQQKSRGGMHITYPNHGPGGESGLMQHGFARDVRWKEYHRGDNTVGLLIPRHIREEYAHIYPYDVDVAQYFRLGESGLSIHLILNNRGDIPAPMNPGFHPYFDVPISGFTLVRDSRGEFAYEQGDFETTDDWRELPMQPAPEDGVIHIGYGEHPEDPSIQVTMRASRNLPLHAIWSDDPDRYRCFEPIAGFPFDPEESFQLEPGHTIQYSIDISAN